MKAKMEQFPAMSPNPVLNVANEGVILYSNEAGEPLLNEWGVKVGEKLPSHVEELVQTVISKNSSEKTEVKVGNRTYLIVFSPLPKQELVSISGFDISDRKELEEKTRENEEKYRTLFNSIDEGFCLVEVIIDDTGKPVDLLMLDYNSVFQQKTGFRFDIKGKNVRSVLTVYEEQWFDTIGEVALTGKSVRFENYVQSLNRWYSSFATRIGGEGSFRVAIIFDDITVRKLAEEALLELKETLEEKVKERTTDLEKAYNSLKDSEKRLAEAQEMAHIGNWEWDIATDKAYWSEEMYRIFKRDPQKMVPSLKEYYSYIHPDDLDYYCKATDYTRKVSTSGFDFRIVLANGEERTLHMKSDFIFEKNTPIRVKGIVQDITESKNAEEKIRYLANIVESSPDAIGTISLDGVITSWNKGAERIYGYSTEEILGKHVSILAPSHLENETMKLIELITHGESYYHYETLRLGKNGREIYVSITYSPILDTNGKLIAISIIGRDITERKRAEEKLRESEEKYRNIVETANEGILLTDNDNIITYVNNKFADMLLSNTHEITGKPIWGFISEEYIPIVQLNLEKRRKGEYGSYELKLKRKDGSPLWIILNAKPLVDKEGNYIGALSMLTDITERKKSDETLRNFEIAQKKEIHHRIKNNLQVVSSLLDLQSDKFKGRKTISDSEIQNAFKESMDRVLSISLIHEELYKGNNVELLNFSQYIQELVE
ncbi:MAG: PAS domain S-box protein, partial [Bacillota bacterium]|nr:PAS domain S-box protein [Bacillota bacterium]